MLTVDLRAKALSDTTGVYVARPGANYRFFEVYIENNFVGPDLPALELPDFNDLDEIPDLVARVARSAAIRSFHTGGRREEFRPVRDLDAYQGRKYGRSISQLTRVARGYFKNMKQGDLVIVPPGSFRGMVEIGEFTAEPHHIRSLAVDRYLGDPLQGRQVRWLASMPKSELPAATLDALQKPSALFQFPRDYRAAIFRRAYGSYYTQDDFSVRFEVKSADFRVTDDLYIQGFFNFVSSNYYRVRDRSSGVVGFREGAFDDLGDRAPKLFTNVNSPGGLSLMSLVVLPIVISALFAVAVIVGPDAYALAQDGGIAIVNSMADAQDKCTIEVSEQVITQMRLLGYDQWVEACKFAKQAAEATGMESGVNVTN